MEHLEDQSWRYHFRSWAVEELDSLEFTNYINDDLIEGQANWENAHTI